MNVCKGCGTEENTSAILMMNTETIYACPKCKPIILKRIEEILRKPIRPIGVDWTKKLNNIRKIGAISNEDKTSPEYASYLKEKELREKWLEERKMSYKEERDSFLHKFMIIDKTYNEKGCADEKVDSKIFYVADIVEGDADDIWKKVCCMFPGICIKRGGTFIIVYPILNMNPWKVQGNKYNYSSINLYREHINHVVSKQKVIEELRKQTGYETLIAELEKDNWEQNIINDVTEKEDELRKGRYHYQVLENVAEEGFIPKTEYIAGKGYKNDYSDEHRYDDIIFKCLDEGTSIPGCAKRVIERIKTEQEN